MKKLLALFAMIMVCSVKSSFAQTGTSVKPVIRTENSPALKFIENIEISPAAALDRNVTSSPKMLNKEALKPHVAEAGEMIEKLTPVQFKYAMLMNVAVEALTDLSLYKFVEEWYGTHYRMGGSTKRGIDCSAFTSTLLMAVYSIAVPRTAREQYKATQHVDRDNLKEGDLVFFNTRGGVSHCGIYLANNFFIHSSSSQGVMISSLDDAYYSKRFISGGRVSGFASL